VWFALRVLMRVAMHLLCTGQEVKLASRRINRLGANRCPVPFFAFDAPAADPPREWSYEPLFDDLPISDPALA
jgi:hypothetical protein